MNEKNILRGKKGAAMEWAIIFGLVIFGICTLLVIVMTSFSTSTRVSTTITHQKSDLDQVGEYFVRAMGTSGLFPAGHVTEDTDFSSDEGYSWMDQETVDFFKRCERDYGFSYSCEYKSERGSFLTFNRPEAFYRKLTVTKAGEPVLTIVIAEDVTYEKERGLIFTRSSNPVSTFNILEWTTNDSVENPDFESESENEPSFLQKLLQWISSLFGTTDEITPGYEIRYDPNGGDIPSGVTFAYYYPGKEPVILPKAIRGGFDFLGWFRKGTDEKVGMDGDSFTTDDGVVLYAKWEEIPEFKGYDVVYYSNGGECDTPYELYLGSPLLLPLPRRDNYSFIGWFTAKDSGVQVGNYNDKYSPMGDVTLYAHWEPETYSIVFNGNTLDLFTFDSVFIKDLFPGSGANRGHEFSSWSISQNTEGFPSSVSGSTVTIPAGAYGKLVLDAEWTPMNYEISYSLKEGTQGASPTVSYTFGEHDQSISLPTPTKSGSRFTGWIITVNTTPASSISDNNLIIPAGATDNLKLEAGWLEYYTVSYNLDGGVQGENPPPTYDSTSSSHTLTLPTPTKTGYDFTGWTTTASGFTVSNKTQLNIPANAKGNITVKAGWTPKTYQIVYDSNGGNSLTNSSYTFKSSSQSVTLSTPTRSGYEFTKWIVTGFTTATPSVSNKTTLSIPAGSVDTITVQAVWAKINSITYDTAGGNALSGTTNRYTEKDTAQTVSLPTPTRTDSDFDGWTVTGQASVSGSTLTINAGATGDIKLTANWSHTLTIDKSNVNSYSVKVNGTAVTPSSNKVSKIKSGDTVEVTVEYNYKEDSKPTLVDSKDKKIDTTISSSTSGDNYIYSFTMPDKNATLSLDGTSECFTADTLITLADGTKKRVDELHVGEEIMTFDHVNGCVSSSPVAYIFKSHLMYDVIKLTFANGTEITVLQGHCFYERDENKYVELNKDNAEEYIGHSFFCMDSMSFVELVSCEISYSYMEAYSVLSAYDINHVANGFLAVSDEIEGLYNYFDFDSDMKYDREKMEKDIVKYGLVTYDMFSDYCTEEEFDVFNCKYLGIAVGKGLTTFESLIERMQKFSGHSA